MPRGHWIERQQLATSQALGGPSARVFHSLVSLNLASEGRLGADLLMFGGQDASWSLLNDLWHYNDSSSAWTQVVPALGWKMTQFHDSMYIMSIPSSVK